MKIVDVAFYFFWRALTMGANYPLSVLNNPTFHKWTKVLFIFATVLYMEDAAIYSPLATRINVNIELSLIAIFIVAVIWCFSKGRDASIISYWGEKRAKSRKLDAIIGWIVFILPFILLFIKPRS